MAAGRIIRNTDKQNVNIHIVSPILSLEAQEQVGEILNQTKYLLLVTGKVWHRWTRSDRAVAVNPLAQAPISINSSYLSSSRLSYRGCTYTRPSIIGQLLVT